MATQTTQLRVTLPVELQGYLQTKASKFGLSLSAYVRNLVINDVKDVDLPTFPMSSQTERTGVHALKEYQQGKTHKVDDVDTFLDSLWSYNTPIISKRDWVST